MRVAVPVVLSVLASVAVRGAVPAPPAPDALTAGVRVERSVAAGDVHTFTLAVTAGSVISLTAEQLGADVHVTWAPPAPAAPIVADDAERGTAGRERLVWRATSDGVVQVAIRIGGRVDPPGRYALRAAVLDPVDGLAEAVDAFNASATVTRGGEPSEAAAQVRGLAATLDVWRRLGDRDLVALTLVRLGHVQLQRASRPLDALRSFQEAAEAFDGLGLVADRVDAQLLVAAAQRQLGLTREALATNERTAALIPQLAPRLQARVQSQLGRTAVELGDAGLGVTYAARAVATYRELGATADLMSALERLADANVGLRRLDEALQAVSEALALADQTGVTPARRGSLLRALGRIHGAGGDTERAIAAYRQARELTPPGIDRLVLELDAARHLGRLTEYATVRDLLEPALASVPPQERNVWAAVATELGVALAQLGDTARARTLQEEALTIAEASGSGRNQIIVLRDLAATVRLQRDLPRSRVLTARMVELARTQPPSEVAAIVLKEQSRDARLAGDLVQAERFAHQAIEAIDASRANLRGLALRAAYGGNALLYYDEAIDLAMARHAAEPAAGHDARGLLLFEQSRARSLADLLASARVDIRAGLDPQLVAREDDLRRQIAMADAAIRAVGSAADGAARIAALEAEIDAHARELIVLDARERETSPRYRAATASPVASVAAMQALLDDDTVLLALACSEAGSRGWAVTPTGVRAFAGGPLREIEAATRRMLEAMHRPGAASSAEAQAASETLGRLVLGPIAGSLRQEWRGRRLAIVASGPLEYVPFAALAVPDTAVPGAATPAAAPHWLSETHEIVVLPSVSVLSLLREPRRRGPATRELVVVADPVYSPSDPRVATRLTSATTASGPGVHRGAPVALSGSRGDFARLVFSRQEARALAQLAGPSKTTQLLDFQATVETLRSPAVAGARRLHLATHGILDATRPERSGLVLSLVDRDGRTTDGILRLNDIFGLSLAAELVVLSGCETGLGRQMRGEGLVGLTRAFMYAGAPRVVSSLWQVDDQATAQLMTRFYTHMLTRGARPAAALAAAQRELAGDPRWAAPYFWAGFVLHGDWR